MPRKKKATTTKSSRKPRKASSGSPETPTVEATAETTEPAAEAQSPAAQQPHAASTSAADAPATGKRTRSAARKRKTSGSKKTVAKKTKRAKKLAAPQKPADETAATTVVETGHPGEALPPAAEPTASSDDSSAAVKPLLPQALVEETNGVVVIRFPPVAPPPFASGAPARPRSASAAESEPEPADGLPSTPSETAPSDIEPQASPPVEPEPGDTALRLVPADERQAEIGSQIDRQSEESDEAAAPSPDVTAPEEAPATRKRRRRGRRKKTREPQPEPSDSVTSTPEPQTIERPQPSEADRQQLSASQKRRLRRKRRTQLTREQTAPAEQQAESGQPSADAEVQAPSPTTSEVESPPLEAPEAATERDAAAEGEARKPKPARSGRRSRPARAARARAVVTEVGGEDQHEAETVHPSKEMIINVSPREECRIAILRDNQLEEIYIERASAENHVGNIYMGIVTNVESSIQAAFVDFGLGKNGFLHISDLHPQHFPDGSPVENVGRKLPRRNRPPIQRCLRRGQQVIVQITKEGIGTKGPTLSTYLSIPGRFLVMMPGMRRLGVSRKIEDDETRAKLRSQLDDLELPEGMGFIARTAAHGRTKRELQSDLKYLSRLWRAVEKRIEGERAPTELYRESDLVTRTIRDLYTPDIGRIVVDDAAIAKRARDFLHIFSPRSTDVVTEYTDPTPIFHKYGIEAELERLHSRHVPLASGGSLVIDPTEALVAIDVNSGRFRAEDDAESTAFKINLEAADEVARQLRLRDLGGVIICDFIDMRVEAHKRELERRLAKNLKEHKERAKILRMSAFGIIEMTRQRQRASLTRSVYQDCRHCRGTGLVKTPESVALDVMRTLQQTVTRDNVNLIEVKVSTEVAMLLLNRKRAVLTDVETKHRRTISIRPDPEFGLDQVDIRCWDQRGRAVGGK